MIIIMFRGISSSTSHTPLEVPTDMKRISVLFLRLLIQSTATSGKEEDGNYMQLNQDKVIKEVFKEGEEVERAEEEGTRHNNSQPNHALVYIALCCHYCSIFI